MFKKIDKEANRVKKHKSIRRKISGTAEKPRLCVYRTLNNISVQVIDDVNAVTLASASTNDKELKASVKNGGNSEAAKLVGAKIAERVKSKGIEEIVFDRAGYVYTGRIKALADAARENGLKF
ncbi:MAG: 50S ribosomal protein L18 [Fusobacteria bacterium]|nr:50S ribosomal protein L18 [Fusobacteriota bacterium]